MNTCSTCLFRNSKKECTNTATLLNLCSPYVGDLYSCERYEIIPKPALVPEEPPEVQIVVLESSDVTVQQLYEILQTLMLEGKGSWEVVYENDYAYWNVDKVVSFPMKKEILLS
jgi:hypothetical protein